MSNNLFKVLSSNTRVQILKLLANNQLHLSELARQLKLSKPVVSRHINILEKAGLINRRILGNMHFLSANLQQLEDSLQGFSEETALSLKEEQTLYFALKQLPNIKIQQIGDAQFISSINGETGYYIYQVDGKTPNKPINEYQLKEDATVSLKKLVAVEKKNIKITVNRHK